MAVIKQGILGGIQNKIGNIVGTSWKGIAVIKSKPISVANPRTSAQVEQRSRFTNAVNFAVAILAQVIKPLWDRFAQKQSGFNAFVSENISRFDSSGLVDGASLVISKGKMASTPIGSVTGNVGTGSVNVTWTNDSGSGFKQASDTAFVVISDNRGNDVSGYDTGVTRSTQNLSVSKTLVAGRTYRVWLAFRRADGTIVSDTSTATFTT